LSSLWTIYQIAPAWNTGGHISSPHEKKPLAGQFGSIAIDGCAVLSQAACAAVAASRPNIVFIFADDMGLGAFPKPHRFGRFN
jgi:hypothetical protein